VGWSKFLFGKTCLGCDERLPVGYEAAWCGSCAPAVLNGGRWIPATWNGDTLPVSAALVYGGPVADAVTRVKKGQLPDLQPVLPLLARLVELVGPRPEPVWLVAVPPHRGRLAERGLHFPDLLATGMACPRRDMRVAWALERLPTDPRRTATEARARRADRRCGDDRPNAGDGGICPTRGWLERRCRRVSGRRATRHFGPRGYVLRHARGRGPVGKNRVAPRRYGRRLLATDHPACAPPTSSAAPKSWPP
jgi:predicted amidophosphoribosyltransferase